MLEQLIALTNRKDFWGGWHLKVEQAQFRNDRLTLILSTIKDDHPRPIDTLKWWHLECKGVLESADIGQLKVPNYKISLLKDHPLLWQYEQSIHLFIKGKAQSFSELLGQLFLAHIETCGNWLDFNSLVSGLHWNLQQKGQADMLLPHRLLKIYQPILEQHGLTLTVESFLNETADLNLLFIGNPNICPDDYRFGQFYVIAKEFSAKNIMPEKLSSEL